MQIERLDHFTIVAQPQEIEQLREFYCEVLGLQPGPRPDFAFDGYWLYPPTGGPMVHLAAITARALPAGVHDTGKLDHISFRSSGLHEFRRHLEPYVRIGRHLQDLLVEHRLAGRKQDRVAVRWPVAAHFSIKRGDVLRLAGCGLQPDTQRHDAALAVDDRLIADERIEKIALMHAAWFCRRNAGSGHDGESRPAPAKRGA